VDSLQCKVVLRDSEEMGLLSGKQTDSWRSMKVLARPMEVLVAVGLFWDKQFWLTKNGTLGEMVDRAGVF